MLKLSRIAGRSWQHGKLCLPACLSACLPACHADGVATRYRLERTVSRALECLFQDHLLEAHPREDFDVLGLRPRIGGDPRNHDIDLRLESMRHLEVPLRSLY